MGVGALYKGRGKCHVWWGPLRTVNGMTDGQTRPLLGSKDEK